MKTAHRKLLTAMAVAALAFTVNPANAALVINQSIGVDFGPTAPNILVTGNHFNQVNPSPSTGGSIAAGGLVSTTNVAVSGVGFSWASSPTVSFSNNDAISIAGQPAVFNESNLTDFMGTSGPNGAVQGFITLTFTGLNNMLTYDLIIGSGFNSPNTDVLWSADSQSGLSDSSSGPNSFVTLSGLSTDGSGNLVILGAGTGGVANRQDLVIVSALHLTAATIIPEPSTALLGGLGLLALLLRRRR